VLGGYKENRVGRPDALTKRGPFAGRIFIAVLVVHRQLPDLDDGELSIEVPGSLLPIRSDRIRFQQILLNLMSNAVKFTPSGGRASLSASIEADGVVIIVQNSGIGMKAEDIPIALEPFRQIDGALSRRFDGTGLGLPLAKALVELHGSRLEIQSAPGAGTMVRIHLPLERMANAAA
jgi:signal transduction histidine kinase